MVTRMGLTTDFFKWINNIFEISVFISNVINVKSYNPRKQKLSGGLRKF